MFLPDFPEKVARELCRITLEEQLRSRRILKIERLPPGWLAKGAITPMVNGFLAEIRPAMSIKESILTFGHELGHTYLYSDDQFPRRLVTRDGPNDPPIEKAWCDNFAKEWIDNLSPEDLCSLTKLLEPFTSMPEEPAPRDVLSTKRYFR